MATQDSKPLMHLSMSRGNITVRELMFELGPMDAEFEVRVRGHRAGTATIERRNEHEPFLITIELDVLPIDGKVCLVAKRRIDDDPGY